MKVKKAKSEAMSSELLERLMELGQTLEGLFGPGGVLMQLKGALMQRILEGEMSAHLGYEKHQVTDSESGRNGHTLKTVQKERGPVTIEVPKGPWLKRPLLCSLARRLAQRVRLRPKRRMLDFSASSLAWPVTTILPNKRRAARRLWRVDNVSREKAASRIRQTSRQCLTS